MLRNTLRKAVTQWGKARLPLSVLAQHVKREAPDADPLDVLRVELTALQESGAIKVPSSVWKQWGDLSTSVTVVRQEAPAPTRHGVAWVPKMAWVPSEGAPFRLEDLQAVNEYLKKVAHPPVAARERSLQVFGDEKRLDGLVHEGALFGGRITLDDLDCYAVQPPLAYWRSGLDAPHLVVENHTTWATVVRAVQEGRLRYGDVIYGAGATVTGSLSHLPSGEVLSFCDLDPAGLAIAVRLHDLAGVKPDLSLWTRMLFKQGLGRTLKPQSVSADVARVFGTDFSTQADALFRAGRWVPQEAVTVHDLC